MLVGVELHLKLQKKTIEKMKKYFNSRSEDIFIAIGPSIRGCCYEVGSEVKNAVCKATGEGNYYTKKNKHYYLDLVLANLVQLKTSGIPEKNNMDF